MAVLAAVAGLTLPAMRGPLDKSRLTSAARQVQAALAKARSLAIRESAVVQVRYEIAGDRFLIERLPLQQQLNITVLDEAGGTMNSPSGLTEQPSPAANAASEVSSDPFKSGTMPDPDELTGTVILREGQLPSGVTFGELAPQQTSESTPITQPAATSDVNLISNSRWSEPVMFQPTGRTSDRVIRLNGQRDFFVEVTLRGLTAMAGYSAPVRGESIAPKSDQTASDQTASDQTASDQTASDQTASDQTASGAAE